MAVPIDYTDLPRVSPESLMVAMRELVATGRGLAPLRGIAAGELRAFENAIWRKLEGTRPEKVSTLLRLRCVIGVFAAARLQRLFLHRGLALMQPAMEVAARMRLNVHWGFSPTKFVHALQERLQQAEQRPQAVPQQRPAAVPVRKSAWQLAAEARRRPAPVAVVASVQQSPKQPEPRPHAVSPRPAAAPARKSAWQLAAEARRRTAHVAAAPA
jgi:hypothetical protein